MYYTFHFLRKSFMFNKSKNSSKNTRDYCPWLCVYKLKKYKLSINHCFKHTKLESVTQNPKCKN